MKRHIAIATLSLLILVFGATAAQAGAKLKINDDAEIDLAFRLQVLGIFTDRDLDGDGSFESYDDFRIRRARFRLKGTVNKHFSMFFQTDVSTDDIRMIDAYINLKKDAGLQAFIGQHLAPSSRQTITSSGALMTIDRPGMIYKALTWGTRSLSTFNTVTYGAGDGGFRSPTNVRDTGITLWGNKEIGDNASFKYYLGLYDGVASPGKDTERTTGRLQFTFGDAESGYYYSSTYLGKKNTFSIGLSYDTQGDVASGNTPQTDYNYWNVDLFTEKPAGGGSFTLEASYHDLDLDDANLAAQGDGFYVAFGYLMPNNKWQIWGHFEDWGSDDPTGLGSHDMFRAGLGYYMSGQNANFKIGLEQFNTDVPMTGSEDSITSLVIGLYTTY